MALYVEITRASSALARKTPNIFSQASQTRDLDRVEIPRNVP